MSWIKIPSTAASGPNCIVVCFSFSPMSESNDSLKHVTQNGLFVSRPPPEFDSQALAIDSSLPLVPNKENKWLSRLSLPLIHSFLSKSIDWWNHTSEVSWCHGGLPALSDVMFQRSGKRADQRKYENKDFEISLNTCSFVFAESQRSVCSLWVLALTSRNLATFMSIQWGKLYVGNQSVRISKD